MAGNLAAFSAALQPLLQQGFLEREIEEGLDSTLAYRREALQETVPSGIGETLTRTRQGRLAPVTTALTPSAVNTGLDNGMTAVENSVEQYTFSVKLYASTQDINLMQTQAAIASVLLMKSRNGGVQAAQSLDRIARAALFSAYLGGNTRVRTALGASSTTTCLVDDIRGFQFVLVNGVVTAVSGGSPLVVNLTGPVPQTLSVTGAVAEVTNHSTAPDGISGTLTFATATAPSDGDCLIAANAPKIFRPFGKTCTNQLVGGDTLTMGLIEDVVAYLRDNAVPPMDDGTFHCALDNTSMRQLFADQDFKILFQGRKDAAEYRDGDIIRLMGVTFIPTTEAYVQAANTVAGIAVKVRRPIIMGAEAIIQGTFEGMDLWLDQDGVDAISTILLVNKIAFILRPPLDRLQENASLSWKWIGDFAIPTDLTATTTTIPTASLSMYKRCAVIEHAG